MAKNKNKIKSEFGLLIILIILGVGLFISTKLVRQNQENRSQAASSGSKSCKSHINCRLDNKLCYGGKCITCTPGTMWCYNDRTAAKCNSSSKIVYESCSSGCKSFQCLPSSTKTKTTTNTSKSSTVTPRNNSSILKLLSNISTSNKSSTTNTSTTTKKTFYYYSYSTKQCKSDQFSSINMCNLSFIRRPCYNSLQECENAKIKTKTAAPPAVKTAVPPAQTSGSTYNQLYGSDEKIIADLNSILTGNLAGKGDVFVYYAKGRNNTNSPSYDRDPYLAASIAMHESWAGWSCFSYWWNNVGGNLYWKTGEMNIYGSINEGIKAIFDHFGMTGTVNTGVPVYKHLTLYNWPKQGAPNYYTYDQFYNMARDYYGGNATQNASMAGWLKDYSVKIRNRVNPNLVNKPGSGNCFYGSGQRAISSEKRRK